MEEFDERKTKEAILAYHYNKLECDIQCKLYDEECNLTLNNLKTKEIINKANLEAFAKNCDTLSPLWIKYGQKNYNYDKNFMSVSNYILKNNIKNFQIMDK